MSATGNGTTLYCSTEPSEGDPATITSFVGDVASHVSVKANARHALPTNCSSTATVCNTGSITWRVLSVSWMRVTLSSLKGHSVTIVVAGMVFGGVGAAVINSVGAGEIDGELDGASLRSSAQSAARKNGTHSNSHSPVWKQPLPGCSWTRRPLSSGHTDEEKSLSMKLSDVVYVDSSLT